MLHGIDADREMVRNLIAVELCCHARQLQLPVEGFVRHAQKRSVRHTEPETVGCNRCRFHIERDCPALGKALNGAALVAQFPVSVVDSGNRPGSHNAFQVIVAKARDFGHSRFYGLLHLRKCRDGNPDRQIVIKNMVFAHIGVGKHVIAKLLAFGIKIL